MSITDFLKWLEDTELSQFMAQSTWGFPAAEMVHIAAIVFVIGLIAMVDLRLLRLAFTNNAVTRLCSEALPWTWAAFAIATVSGALLFTSQPVKYFGNFAFQMKVVLMALAGINVLVFHFVTYRGVAAWDSDRPVPVAGRLAGFVSIGLWIAVVVYGRLTGYYAAER